MDDRRPADRLKFRSQLPRACTSNNVTAPGVRIAAMQGAHLLVSPGLTPDLHEAAWKSGRVLVPGVQTASEVMAARRLANVAAVGGSWMLAPDAMDRFRDDRSRFLAARPHRKMPA